MPTNIGSDCGDLEPSLSKLEDSVPVESNQSISSF
ncbi:uncharacterized protein J3R85_003586 [Psidium guajava]|nr:uncharacterized protein J3R85_003586 [Psidium guajava]